eukprot:UN06163
MARKYVSLNTKAALATLSTNKLIDMEWNFGISVSSDSLKHLGNTFLHIKLVIEESGNEKPSIWN